MLLAALGVLVALAYLGWGLSDSVASVSAHLISKSDHNGPLAMRAPWGIPFPVTVDSSGSTNEYRSGAAMVTDSHENVVIIPNGKCGKATSLYPACFSLVNPRAIYSHSSNSYTLIGSNHWDPAAQCFVGVNDLAECWSSDTLLGWATIPIDAEMKRTVTIQPGQTTPYVWATCACGIKVITNDFQVNWGDATKPTTDTLNKKALTSWL